MLHKGLFTMNLGTLKDYNFILLLSICYRETLLEEASLYTVK